MKKLLHAALFAACCHGALAADRAVHFEAALARAKTAGKDIVVYQRGSDWNRLGERLYASVWLKPEFDKALGDGFVLVAVDNPEVVGGPAAASLKQLTDKNVAPPPNEITAIESESGIGYVARLQLYGVQITD